jgi:hypothetical protein
VKFIIITLLTPPTFRHRAMYVRGYDRHSGRPNTTINLEKALVFNDFKEALEYACIFQFPFVKIEELNTWKQEIGYQLAAARNTDASTQPTVSCKS